MEKLRVFQHSCATVFIFDSINLRAHIGLDSLFRLRTLWTLSVAGRLRGCAMSCGSPWELPPCQVHRSCGRCRLLAFDLPPQDCLFTHSMVGEAGFILTEVGKAAKNGQQKGRCVSTAASIILQTISMRYDYFALKVSQAACQAGMPASIREATSPPARPHSREEPRTSFWVPRYTTLLSTAWSP